MFKRLFTFGCSYTKYNWPTWADIIAYDQQIEFHNYGLSGIGNVSITSLMLECDLKHKFTDTDLILVNWSSWHREDRVDSKGKWIQNGNIFTGHHFNKKFIKQYWNEHNDIVKNTDAIISANRMFNINYQSHMVDYEFSLTLECLIRDLVDEVESPDYITGRYHNRFSLMMPKKNVFYKIEKDRTGFQQSGLHDNHPDILCHLNHAKTVYKELGMTLNERTIEKYENLQRVIVQDLISNPILANKNVEKFFSNDKYM